MKFLLGWCVVFCLSSAAVAQGQEIRTYELSLGIGAATNYYEDYRASSGAGIRLTAETLIKEIGGGQLKAGISGIFSGTNATFEVQQFKAKYYWNNYALAARGVFSYPFSESLHGYGGLHLGFRSTHFRYTSSGSQGTYVVPDYSRVNFLSGAFLGVDYQWSDKFFIFSEAGYDQLWFTLGAKMKL
ncbi:MAG: hypothetical protein EP332_02655 [Bacteroidetes bacterium]|nr:MAG: hypothetical protein EP332_02655 [Bacteroidota bacterium]